MSGGLEYFFEVRLNNLDHTALRRYSSFSLNRDATTNTIHKLQIRPLLHLTEMDWKSITVLGSASKTDIEKSVSVLAFAGHKLILTHAMQESKPFLTCFLNIWIQCVQEYYNRRCAALFS